MFKCEILENHNAVDTRNVTNKISGEINTYYNQYAYVMLPDSPFPQKMKVPVENPAMAYPVGQYQIDPRCFHIGNFDSLSVNSFNLKLIKLETK